MEGIKGVIFDLDGTLIDSLETYTKAVNRGATKFNLRHVPEEELANLLNMGLGIKAILAELYPFLDEEALDGCFQEVARAYTEMEKEGVTLRQGVKETLTLLRERGVKIGIVTGRTTTGKRKWLELRRLGIDHFIDSMVTGADAPRKPAPDGITKCLQELGLSAEESVYVGDSQTDIITGKGAGVRTIAVAGGVAKKELLRQERPDIVVNNLSELPFQIGCSKAQQSL